MRFDADRLANLAGIGGSTSRSLNEASNRTMHDEKYYQDEVSWRVGKNQLSEADEADADGAECIRHGKYQPRARE